jgi:hypothetical protein
VGHHHTVIVHSNPARSVHELQETMRPPCIVLKQCNFSVGSCVYSHGLSLPLKLLMYINVEVDGFREKFAVWQQLSPSRRPPFFAVFTSSIFASAVFPHTHVRPGLILSVG